MYNFLASFAGKNDRFRSAMYDLLVRVYSRKSLRKQWKKAWKQIILANVQKPVATTLHGFPAVVNTGFSYPLVARTNGQFNNPLLQLAHQVHQAKQRPIYVIDVGAAIGDTVFFLQGNMPGAFEKILCVDGDKDFFSYLEKNMQQFPFVQSVNTLLSSESRMEKSLVRLHAGTASAQGDSEVEAISLDELVEQTGMPQVDLLKIDTDGFDGKVLLGAKNILSQHKPAVIFEWHPILVSKTGNQTHEAFDILASSGYNKFVFFTKYGQFSHFMNHVDHAALSSLSQLCFNNKHDDDWHYDVVALNDDAIDAVQLAEAAFAKKKKSVI
ncbi:FkbM family methyltransferase [Aridibaculum aurantiacum]|uniref:FkbM family methyltransferase n=1 Tax=Aridibaculum aurantiacum TaxID=2810307 RepID=UPI001A95F74A|nr:FkbM family methyltransferase [Aridibaculum aurantiacum]